MGEGSVLPVASQPGWEALNFGGSVHPSGGFGSLSAATGAPPEARLTPPPHLLPGCRDGASLPALPPRPRAPRPGPLACPQALHTQG